MWVRRGCVILQYDVFKATGISNHNIVNNPIKEINMKTCAALLALAGSAAAFAPAQQARSSSALANKPFADAVGAQAPVS